MRLTQVGVKIFRDEVKALENSLPPLYKSIEDWLGMQREREQWGSVDQYWLGVTRDKIERQINDFHDRLSALYDLMGDKGMVDRELI